MVKVYDFIGFGVPVTAARLVSIMMCTVHIIFSMLVIKKNLIVNKNNLSRHMSVGIMIRW